MFKIHFPLQMKKLSNDFLKIKNIKQFFAKKVIKLIHFVIHINEFINSESELKLLFRNTF